MDRVLREKIGKLIYLPQCGVPDEIDQEWAEAGENWQQNCMQIADLIFVVIKEAGYVKLAEDQSLPRNPHIKKIVYEACQLDMLKAGFRKVEL